MANEKRLIDANALDFDFPVTDDLIETGIEMVKARVVTAPTIDAVEVVRCKDCKHWRENTLWCDMNSRDRGANFNWYAEDFCSYGERREGE